MPCLIFKVRRLPYVCVCPIQWLSKPNIYIVCYCEQPLSETTMWFIEINDKMEMHARVFISNNLGGEKQDSGETERERECESVRDRVLLETRDSVSNKIDH